MHSICHNFCNSIHKFLHNYSLEYKKPTQKSAHLTIFIRKLLNKWQYEIEMEDLYTVIYLIFSGGN